MAAGRLFLPGWMPALDSDGAPIPNASVYFYLNKTDTLASVYSDQSLTTPLTNPIYANSSGRFPQIWASDAATYSYSVDAPYGPAGIPFTGDDLTVSISMDLIAVGAAEAAADEAEASAAIAAAALAEIEDIAANAPDAPSVVNKANRDGGNLTGTEPDEFRAAINGASRDLTDITDVSFNIWRRDDIFADLRPSYSGSVNSANFSGAVTLAQGKRLILPTGVTVPMTGLVSVAGVREIAGGGATLDWTLRGSAGTLLSASGTLGVTTYALTTDALVDTDVLTFASVIGLTEGAVLLLTSNRKEHPAAGNESQFDGERVQILKITGSGPYSVQLMTSLRLSYVMADAPKVQIISQAPAITISDLSIIGTGQQYSNGAQNSGDQGFAFDFVDSVELRNVHAIRANRQAFRVARCGTALVDNWSADFQPYLAVTEIQYGVAVIGCMDKVTVSNGYQRRGRHGIDQVGDAIGGFTFNLTTFNNTIRDTYEAGIGEHSGLHEALYQGDTMISCGAGYDIRGKFRRIVNPRVIDCYNGAVGGEAFVLGGNVTDLDVVNMDVDNVRYISLMQTVDLTDNHAPRRITFTGGTARRFANGINIEHKGGENPTLPGTYNTTVGGKVECIGVNFVASYPREVAVSANPFTAGGYFRELRMQGCSVEFEGATTPGNPCILRGADRIVVKENEFINARAAVTSPNSGGQSVIDAAGALAVRNPLYISGKTNDFIGLVTDTLPFNVGGLTSATTKMVFSANSASNTDWPMTIRGGTAVALTIAAGVVTLPATGASSITIDTEALAATDDLDTINGGVEGDILTVRTTNNARDITLKRLTGNLVPGIADLVLTNVLDQTTFRKNNANQWIAIADINNG